MIPAGRELSRGYDKEATEHLEAVTPILIPIHFEQSFSFPLLLNPFHCHSPNQRVTFFKFTRLIAY